MILGFNAEFVPAICAGAKVHTIRQGARWRVGQPIHFYALTPPLGTFLFWPTRPVVSLQQVEIANGRLHLDGHLLTDSQLAALAQADGFPDATSFLAFFDRYASPFHGQLVHWTALRY